FGGAGCGAAEPIIVQGAVGLLDFGPVAQKEALCSTTLMESPRVFQPKKGATQWWSGDPETLTLLYPGELNRHVLIRPKTLSPDQCRLLIECFERNREACATKDADAYWAGRFIWQDALPVSEIHAIRVMQQVRLVAQILLNQATRVQRPLY